MSTGPEGYFRKNSIHNTAPYLVSALPYITSSLVIPADTEDPLELEFPYVTRFVTIKNDHASDDLRVGVTSTGTSGSYNYFVLAPDTSYTAEWKLTSIFLLSNTGSVGEATVIAGLTNINDAEGSLDSTNLAYTGSGA
jgi:hypothetical protein